MLKVEIAAIGKLKESYLREACAEYSKRLGAYCQFTVTELKEYRLPDDPSPAQIEKCLEEEGSQILARLGKDSCLVSMCIEGKELSSPELSKKIQEFALGGASHLVFAIGGSHGLSQAVKQKSKLRLSMSPMTFPHQLARVMLMEQIYRGFTIAAGSKYHK